MYRGNYQPNVMIYISNYQVTEEKFNVIMQQHEFEVAQLYEVTCNKVTDLYSTYFKVYVIAEKHNRRFQKHNRLSIQLLD